MRVAAQRGLNYEEFGGKLLEVNLYAGASGTDYISRQLALLPLRREPGGYLIPAS
jgi:hypothetical protein